MPDTYPDRPRLAVHKFTSCDGCQLALLNLGEELLELARRFDIVHFPEAGMVAPEAQVEIALVEGSISTREEQARITSVRQHAQTLITVGACATSGGLQALRNAADSKDWIASIYPQPQHITSLADSSPIRAHVRVDFELWGCPVSGPQLLTCLQALLAGIRPRDDTEAICMTCKRAGVVCRLVARGSPCLGPLTRTGCGALCPRYGRDCYGCYGPADNPNTGGLARRFAGLGLVPEEIARRLHFIHSSDPAFALPSAEDNSHEQ